jgi:outer membrane protein OmpA-like peptidoglycan-associated protein
MKSEILQILTALTFFIFPNIHFGQAPNLRSTVSFALFTAAGAFDNTGNSVIQGDIGSKTYTATGFPPGTTLHVVILTEQRIEEMMRFSITFEFDDSESILIYKKYLTDIVIPKIPLNGKVILYGHTDIIGDEEHNSQLSLQRMRTVRTIIENSLQKTGRKDVVFEEYWYGEDEVASPFANKFPEERFYNRTVIIDIIPKTRN